MCITPKYASYYSVHMLPTATFMPRLLNCQAILNQKFWPSGGETFDRSQNEMSCNELFGRHACEFMYACNHRYRFYMHSINVDLKGFMMHANACCTCSHISTCDMLN